MFIPGDGCGPNDGAIVSSIRGRLGGGHTKIKNVVYCSRPPMDSSPRTTLLRLELYAILRGRQR